MAVLPVNKIRFNMLTRIWPVTFAAYLSAQAIYGSGAQTHPTADRWFDLFSWVVVVMLLLSASLPRLVLVRTFSGVGIIGVTLARAGWFFDPSFVASQRLFAASVYAVVLLSSLGWVMAADHAVVSKASSET